MPTSEARSMAARANNFAFLAILALVGLVAVMSWDRSHSAQASREWAAHSREVRLKIRDLSIGVRDAETSQRGYLLTGSEDYLAPFQPAMDRISGSEAALRAMTADNSAQQQRLVRLDEDIRHKLEEMTSTIALGRSGNFPAALQIVRSDEGRRLMLAVQASLDELDGAEAGLLDTRMQAFDREQSLGQSLAFVGVALVAIALVLTFRLLVRAREQVSRAYHQKAKVAERLQVLLDSLSHGIGVFDADRRLSQWNECFHELLELPRAITREGSPYAVIAEHVADAGAPPLETEDELRHGPSSLASGGPIIYERQSDASGKVFEYRRTDLAGGGFVVTISDITQRTRTEALLRDAHKMRAFGQLTGGIAHDFNNLLTVILGNIEAAMRKLGEDSPVTVLLERAVWGAQRGATLTGQLLAFARKQPLEPRPLSLAEVLPEVAALLKRTLGETIDVRVVEAAGLWDAMADVAQLESALLNLALNARDAMPGGGRLTIEVGNRVLDDEYAARHAEVNAGDYVMLAVSDTGCGMSPDIAAKVFEPFFTTKAPGQGTGLGLAMVFGFVKQSGGHVKLYSEPGHGTTVKIYLPRAAVPAPPWQRSAAPMELPGGHETILIVEDEAAVREVAVEILRELGYRVIEAGEGDAALRLFGAHAAEIDLLLVDVVLPGPLRGRDIAERITAMRPDVGVLYMSGYTENAIIHHGKLDDGVNLLSKPFKREQLARKVSEVLRKRRGAAPHPAGG